MNSGGTDLAKNKITFIILGATGDLTSKKLIPALNKLSKEYEFNLVAVSRRDYTLKDYKDYLKKQKVSVNKNINLTYFKADFGEKDSLHNLKNVLKTVDNANSERIFYLATSPSFYADIVNQLGSCCKNINTKLLIEKPFGNNLKTSKELDLCLKKKFSEDKIFRVDHYLGKETVNNILTLRLSNPFLESTWNSKFIDTIKVVVSEDIDVKGRMEYYDKTGALKDMIQNHLLQILSFLLMKPPKSTDSLSIQKEKVKALKKLKFVDLKKAQYKSYLSDLKKETNKNTSKTETYVNLTLKSNSRNWRGTKIVLQTGKKLKKKEAYIEIIYKKKPCYLYCDLNTNPNKLVIKIQPKQDIDFHLNTRRHGSVLGVENVKMKFRKGKKFLGNTPEAYEILLDEAIKNRKTLFITQKELEQSWKLIDDITKKTKNYELFFY